MNHKKYQRKLSAYGNIKFIPLVLLVALVGAGAGAWFGARSGNSFSGSKLDSSVEIDKVQAQLTNTLLLPEDFKTVPDFDLLDKNGEAATSDMLKNQWSLLFFGFTQCPDVCPITLAEVNKALTKIKQEHRDLPVANVVFVSVDPKRDTPDLLKSYVEFFDPDFNALTGELNNLFALTQPLNIVVSFSANKENPENYTVDHTAAMLLVDPNLRIRAKLNAPHTQNVLVQDYVTLMKHLALSSGKS